MLKYTQIDFSTHNVNEIGQSSKSRIQVLLIFSYHLLCTMSEVFSAYPNAENQQDFFLKTDTPPEELARLSYVV